MSTREPVTPDSSIPPEPRSVIFCTRQNMPRKSAQHIVTDGPFLGLDVRRSRTMPGSEFAYKQDHPFEKRSAEAARIREK